jgi:hypothetical protein
MVSNYIEKIVLEEGDESIFRSHSDLESNAGLSFIKDSFLKEAPQKGEGL